MAKKKVVRKKAAPRRKVTRRKPAVKAKEMDKPKRILVTPGKFRLVTRNLIMFIVLSLLSFVLGTLSQTQVYVDFFVLLGWILAFIALAFLISLLVLLFLKALRK
jgi:hypothetical protein